jgi:predicted transcriptional regulator
MDGVEVNVFDFTILTHLNPCHTLITVINDIQIFEFGDHIITDWKLMDKLSIPWGIFGKDVIDNVSLFSTWLSIFPWKFSICEHMIPSLVSVGVGVVLLGIVTRIEVVSVFD